MRIQGKPKAVQEKEEKWHYTGFIVDCAYIHNIESYLTNILVCEECMCLELVFVIGLKKPEIKVLISHSEL
jgi:hypothetical protein